MPDEPFKVVVLGGYGAFGSHVSRRLAADETFEVVVAGRSEAKARALAAELPNAAGRAIDAESSSLAEVLRALEPDLLINAVGPFREGDHHVAAACVKTGVHYIDLADGRAFVRDIRALDEAAKEADVLAISGASAFPGLSSMAADLLRTKFASVEAITMGLSPGNRAPRGRAAVETVLGFAGQPIPGWENGTLTIKKGWQGPQRLWRPQLGKRWYAHCDVPDLSLFPLRYYGVERVTCLAGLELPIMHLGLWLLSWLPRSGLVETVRPLAPAIHFAADLLSGVGTDRGGMFVEMEGVGKNGRPSRQAWILAADKGHGPIIPAIPSVLLAKKFAHGALELRGAMPCMGLFNQEEFLDEVSGLAISATLVEG